MPPRKRQKTSSQDLQDLLRRSLEDIQGATHVAARGSEILTYGSEKMQVWAQHMRVVVVRPITKRDRYALAKRLRQTFGNPSGR